MALAWQLPTPANWKRHTQRSTPQAMNTRTLQAAISEAERFLDLARELQDQLKESRGFVTGTRTSGSCRRASLDLTRALADMRRPL